MLVVLDIPVTLNQDILNRYIPLNLRLQFIKTSFKSIII